MSNLVRRIIRTRLLLSHHSQMMKLAFFTVSPFTGAQGMENAIKVQSDANVRRGSVVRIAQRLYVHLRALGTGIA